MLQFASRDRQSRDRQSRAIPAITLSRKKGAIKLGKFGALTLAEKTKLNFFAKNLVPKLRGQVRTVKHKQVNFYSKLII